MSRRSGPGTIHGDRQPRQSSAWRLSRLVALIIVLTAGAGVWPSLSRADGIVAADRITFWFEVDGKPYDRPLDFVVRCYGYMLDLGSLTREDLEKWLDGESPWDTFDPTNHVRTEVYTLAESCPQYGCTVREAWLRHVLLTRRIDYCDMEVSTEGKHFTIARYAETFPFDSCTGQSLEFGGDLSDPLPGRYCVHANLPSSTGLTASPSRAAVLMSYAARTARTYAVESVSAVRARLAPPLGPPVARFPLALALTLAVEVPVLLPLARVGLKGGGVGHRRTVLVGILASSLTLPLLWFAVHAVASLGDYVLAGEFVVFVIEAVLYRALLGVSTRRAALLSLVTNVLSFYAGLVVL